MGKFVTKLGVEESMVSVDVTAVLSFLFISNDNEAVVAKSISDVSFLSRDLFERGIEEGFSRVEIKML